MTKKRTYQIKYLAILALWLVSLFFMPVAHADQLNSRSVTVNNPRPNEFSDQLFTFSYPQNTSIGSLVFEYCDNSALLGSPCNPPTGFDVSAATLDFQTGVTGFGIHPNTTANRMVLSRPASNGGPGLAQYLFGNVKNHNTANDTVYVRIYVLPSTDGTGPYTDGGAVAYSTSESITVGAYVPPFLLFCVGVTVQLDCTSTSGNFIDLNELQPTLTSAGTSQYAGATNDESGYTVSIFGTTMTSGNNVIPALTTAGASIPGVSQFGINLRDNSSPDVGSDVIGPGTSIPKPGYNTPNSFKFKPGEIISSSPVSTSYDRFTVSYIVNVSQDQPPGIYNSTFTYIAVASF